MEILITGVSALTNPITLGDVAIDPPFSEKVPGELHYLKTFVAVYCRRLWEPHRLELTGLRAPSGWDHPGNVIITATAPGQLTPAQTTATVSPDTPPADDERSPSL